VAKAFPPDRMVQMLMRCIDAVVTYLRMLIMWLMDAPAGLKLNSVLSGALGKFFLYHIHLWVTFLQLSAPFVSRGLTDYMTALTWLGFGMQVAVAQDTLNLITFHVHCFYAYARRLFLSQTSGLLSLWRLFLGKKYNPLRKRVDSSAHDVDQLFVGTVAFTILLFLYPTTLMYFAVFKILELVLTAVQGAASFITHSVASIAETDDHDFR
jgi:phosphatidylinositol glycan class Q protein